MWFYVILILEGIRYSGMKNPRIFRTAGTRILAPNFSGFSRPSVID